MGGFPALRAATLNGTPYRATGTVCDLRERGPAMDHPQVGTVELGMDCPAPCDECGGYPGACDCDPAPAGCTLRPTTLGGSVICVVCGPECDCVVCLA